MLCLLTSGLFCSYVQAQVDSAGLEKVFGKKGTVQGDVFKITYPRSDLKVTINDFAVAPGLALTSWIAFMTMGSQTMMMGDLVMQDEEVSKVVNKLISLHPDITAIHNHLANENQRLSICIFQVPEMLFRLPKKLNRRLRLPEHQ